MKSDMTFNIALVLVAVTLLALLASRVRVNLAADPATPGTKCGMPRSASGAACCPETVR